VIGRSPRHSPVSKPEQCRSVNQSAPSERCIVRWVRGGPGGKACSGLPRRTKKKQSDQVMKQLASWCELHGAHYIRRRRGTRIAHPTQRVTPPAVFSLLVAINACSLRTLAPSTRRRSQRSRLAATPGRLLLLANDHHVSMQMARAPQAYAKDSSPSCCALGCHRLATGTNSNELANHVRREDAPPCRFCCTCWPSC
jgi:hypothetical protein